MNTRPIVPSEFWSLFQEWAVGRITPGALWMPGGWSDWAAQDFVGFMLDAALTEAADPMKKGYTKGVPYDVALGYPGSVGGGDLTYVMNLNHPMIPSYGVKLHAHSLHQSHEEFLRQIELEVVRMETGRFSGNLAYAIPAVVALALHHEGANHLTHHHNFQHHFSVQIPTGTGTPHDVHVLSRRFRPHAHRGHSGGQSADPASVSSAPPAPAAVDPFAPMDQDVAPDSVFGDSAVSAPSPAVASTPAPAPAPSTAPGSAGGSGFVPSAFNTPFFSDNSTPSQ